MPSIDGQMATGVARFLCIYFLAFSLGSLRVMLAARISWHDRFCNFLTFSKHAFPNERVGPNSKHVRCLLSLRCRCTHSVTFPLDVFRNTFAVFVRNTFVWAIPSHFRCIPSVSVSLHEFRDMFVAMNLRQVSCIHMEIFVAFILWQFRCTHFVLSALH